MYSPTAGSSFPPGLEWLLIVTIIPDALAASYVTHRTEPLLSTGCVGRLFFCLPANYENSRNGPVCKHPNNGRRLPGGHHATRNGLDCAFDTPSSDLVARLELHARGCHCPRGLSPSDDAGICFCDPTPQLSLPASHITATKCLRCIAGTGLGQDREGARVTARRRHGPS